MIVRKHVRAFYFSSFFHHDAMVVWNFSLAVARVPASVIKANQERVLRSNRLD